MSSRRRIVLWSVLALCLYGLFYAFLDRGGPAIVDHALRQPRKDELTFQFQRCDRTAGFDAPAPPAMSWEDPRTLRIDAIALANCSANWIFGDYAMRGNTIKLEYTAISPQYVLCNCEYQITYRIRGLAKKDYRLELTPRPEVYTAWMPMSLIAATVLIAVLIGVAYGAATLVAWRYGRSKAATMLAILLAFSATANLLLGYSTGSLMLLSMESATINDNVLVGLGRRSGRERADRDFASGMPRWFSMDASEGLPANRPERTFAVIEDLDWAGEAYRRAYIEGYNSRMDKHVPPPKPRGGQGKK